MFRYKRDSPIRGCFLFFADEKNKIANQSEVLKYSYAKTYKLFAANQVIENNSQI